MHVLVVCLNPTLQRTLVVGGLRVAEVNRVVEHRTDASGKGVNAGRVLAQLGAGVIHITQSGGHDHDIFCRRAEADGIEMDGVKPDIELRHAITIVDRHNATTTEVVEEGFSVPTGVETRIRERYAARIAEVDAVLIAGSKAPGFSNEILPWMVEQAKAAHRFVLLDYRGADLLASLPHQPDVVKPNLVEFAHTFLSEQAGSALSEHEHEYELLVEAREKMLDVHMRFATDIVCTRGGQPALYVRDGEVREEVAPQITPVNTIGSGDAFGAALLYKRLEGASLAEAVRFGHECAATNACVLKPGSLR